MIEPDDSPDNIEYFKAQYLVCGYLKRACRQAMFEIALDDHQDPNVRHLAIESLRAILNDWADAQSWLRREISRRPRDLHPLASVS
jgi:hypothetical protein